VATLCLADVRPPIKASRYFPSTCWPSRALLPAGAWVYTQLARPPGIHPRSCPCRCPCSAIHCCTRAPAPSALTCALLRTGGEGAQCASDHALRAAAAPCRLTLVHARDSPVHTPALRLWHLARISCVSLFRALPMSSPHPVLRRHPALPWAAATNKRAPFCLDTHT
jgi:hypothetical protein